MVGRDWGEEMRSDCLSSVGFPLGNENVLLWQFHNIVNVLHVTNGKFYNKFFKNSNSDWAQAGHEVNESIQV